MKNVLELLQSKGIETRKASSTHGGEYHSACPGCGGKDRFHVWPGQNSSHGSYWCRGCDSSGDSIQFLRDFASLSFKEACIYLDKEIPAHQPLRPPPASTRAETWKPTAPEDPPELWMKKAGDLVNWAHEKLMGSTSRKKELEHRGITEKSIKTFHLGWNPGRKGKDLFRTRESWGLPTEIKDNGQKKKLWIPAGLIIPLMQSEKVLRVRIRTKSGRPKYYVLPGSSGALLITHPSHRRAVCVTAAELDGILVDQEAGDVVSSLSLGSCSTKPDTVAAAALDSSAVILNALDYDKAGTQAQQWWAETYPGQIRWPVPTGKDPGDAFKQGVSIRDWVLAGIPNHHAKNRTAGMEPLDCMVEGKGGSERDHRKVEKPEPDIKNAPEALRELVALLKNLPVKIHKRNGSTRLIENQTWLKRNWELSQKVSGLVYLNPENFEYIEDHPAGTIDGRNFWRGYHEKNSTDRANPGRSQSGASPPG